MKVVIRPFRRDDAPALAEIFFAAIHQVASAYYAPEQIGAWAPRVPEACGFIRRAEDGRALLVAVDGDGRPIAYADVESDGHIDHFYCRPEFTRSGVAATLYQAVEQAARARGITRLHVEASEPALRFFAKRGFETVARNDFDMNGVAIHNYRMAKQLD